MALRREVVDLIRLHFLYHANQIGGIGQIAVVQDQAPVGRVRILVEMVDAVGVEQRGAALDAVYLVALGQQQFGQVHAVLAGDTGDQCAFAHAGSLAAGAGWPHKASAVVSNRVMMASRARWVSA